MAEVHQHHEEADIVERQLLDIGVADEATSLHIRHVVGEAL